MNDWEIFSMGYGTGKNSNNNNKPPKWFIIFAWVVSVIDIIGGILLLIFLFT